MPINPVAAQAKKRAARTVTEAMDCIVAVESPLFFVALSVGSFADQRLVKLSAWIDVHVSRWSGNLDDLTVASGTGLVRS